MQDLISVLVPAYNVENLIEDCVKSILQQSYVNFELIICDDCSTDTTYDKIVSLSRVDPRIKIYKNETNKGYLLTFNYLLSLAGGQFICFVDADDLIARDKLRLQYEFLLSNPQISLVGCNFCSINYDGKIIKKSSLNEDHDEILSKFDNTSSFDICGSSVMIRKDVVDKIGGYREYFKGCVGEDIDWVLRISEVFVIANISYCGYFYRFNPNSLTRRVCFTLKQRHILDIIKFLAKQRHDIGVDSIDINDLKPLNDYIKSLNLQYKDNPSSYYKKIAIEFAINKDRSMSKMYLRRYNVMSHSLLEKIKVNFIVNVLLNVDYGLLLSAKKIMNLNHLSDNV